MSGSLKQPLTLLCAPAGFGKTTLLSAWVNEAVDRPVVAWLGLDEDDSDPVRFFDYLEVPCKVPMSAWDARRSAGLR